MIGALFMAAWLHATAATEIPPVNAWRVELAGSIPDVEVVDHEGRTRRFYTDLVRGKTVVVNAIYTRCTNVCPLLGHSFRELQNALGDRLGNEVHLISISRDPENDTPEILAAWRRRFEGRAGWTFVTGEKEAVDAILELLTGDRSYTGGHSAIALLGDDVTGIWLSDYGAAEPERYQHLLRYLAQTRAAQSAEPPGTAPRK